LVDLFELYDDARNGKL